MTQFPAIADEAHVTKGAVTADALIAQRAAGAA